MDFSINPQIIKKNRELLKSISFPWVTEEEMDSSIYRYGLPSYEVFRDVQTPCNDEPTHTDFLCQLIDEVFRGVEEKINYLEIGCSFGKNILQVMHHARRGNFTAIDLEKISQFLMRNIHVMPAYTFTYKQMNVFNSEAWQDLNKNGEPFNFIFSDARHDEKGVLAEFENLEKNELLSKKKLVYVWDDIYEGNDIEKASGKIIKKLAPSFSQTIDKMILCNGWTGQNEAAHHIRVFIGENGG